VIDGYDPASGPQRARVRVTRCTRVPAGVQVTRIDCNFDKSGAFTN
jgi:hypothetical protein